jgi:hypothetical protein
MDRFIEPELLDHLDPADPEAVRSRRELRWINAIMGNHRWMRSMLRKHRRAQDAVLEIGAGDGGLMLDCIRRGLVPARQVSALDFSPRPGPWPPESSWSRQSVFDPGWPSADVVVANLFLHHFDASQLARIGERLRVSRLLLLSEPARRTIHLAQGALLAAVAGFGRVTRHDMMASIRAGFAGDDLIAALGLRGWQCDVSVTLLGAYRVVARNPAVAAS